MDANSVHMLLHELPCCVFEKTVTSHWCGFRFSKSGSRVNQKYRPPFCSAPQNTLLNALSGLHLEDSFKIHNLLKGRGVKNNEGGRGTEGERETERDSESELDRQTERQGRERVGKPTTSVIRFGTFLNFIRLYMAIKSNWIVTDLSLLCRVCTPLIFLSFGEGPYANSHKQTLSEQLSVNSLMEHTIL